MGERVRGESLRGERHHDMEIEVVAKVYCKTGGNRCHANIII